MTLGELENGLSEGKYQLIPFFRLTGGKKWSVQGLVLAAAGIQDSRVTGANPEAGVKQQTEQRADSQQEEDERTSEALPFRVNSSREGPDSIVPDLNSANYARRDASELVAS